MNEWTEQPNIRTTQVPNKQNTEQPNYLTTELVVKDDRILGVFHRTT